MLGGISEPSLYGIHLRYKRIYPRMLVGCLTGGLIIGLFGGVKTNAFAFTSLLTIPVFSSVGVYALAAACAFIVSMILIIIFDYRTPQQRAEARGELTEDAVSLSFGFPYLTEPLPETGCSGFTASSPTTLLQST